MTSFHHSISWLHLKVRRWCLLPCSWKKNTNQPKSYTLFFPKGVNDEQELFMGNMIINSQCPLNRLWLVYTWGQSQLIPSGGPFRQFFGLFWCDDILCGICGGRMHIWDWLVVWNMNFMTFHILGMSSSQLTNSIIFQRGWNHQPGEFFLEFKFLRSVEGSKVSLPGLRPMSSSSQGTRIPFVGRARSGRNTTEGYGYDSTRARGASPSSSDGDDSMQPVPGMVLHQFPNCLRFQAKNYQWHHLKCSDISAWETCTIYKSWFSTDGSSVNSGVYIWLRTVRRVGSCWGQVALSSRKLWKHVSQVAHDDYFPTIDIPDKKPHCCGLHGWPGGIEVPAESVTPVFLFMYFLRWVPSLITHFVEDRRFEKLSGAVLAVSEMYYLSWLRTHRTVWLRSPSTRGLVMLPTLLTSWNTTL